VYLVSLNYCEVHLPAVVKSKHHLIILI